MSAQKLKKLLQSLRISRGKKITLSHSVGIAAPVIAVVALFFIAVSVPHTATRLEVHGQTVTYKKNTSSSDSVKHAQVSQPAASTTPATKTTTATPSVPVAKPHPTVTTPVVEPSTAPVEPIVTPSPSSSVSGLSPTTPATPAPTTTPSSQPPTAQAIPPVTTGYTSSNWSGYMATTGSYTSIAGSWTATNATGNGRTTSADSTWIGIGGVTAADLIQVGTQNIISAAGQVVTSAFYELLPDASDTIAAITVSPGDSITASISEVSTGQWTISIADTTDGQSDAISVSYNSSLSSAEWIEEDPSYSFRQQIPFDNFQEASFTNGSTIVAGTTDSISASAAQPITMLSRTGQDIAVPSAIGTDGASFTITP